jgi:hypothetical protein
MVRQLPNRDVLLGHLQLDENDLLKGIKWHHYIQQVIETNKTEAKLPGGIGRDWSFGWTPLLNGYGLNISSPAPALSQGLASLVPLPVC